MLEAPNIPYDLLIACVREQYQKPAASIEFLPIGLDTTAWAYRVRSADGTTWFLKLKKGAIYEASLLVPRLLHDRGIIQVVAPLTTRTDTLWTQLNSDYFAILYPFIEGGNGMDVGLSDEQWVIFGHTFKEIHSVVLPDNLQAHVRQETFVPSQQWRQTIMRLDTHIQNVPPKNTFEQEFAKFWMSQRDEIHRIIGRAMTLGLQLQTKPSSLVLCHADIHTANLLLTPAGELRVVDWDQLILAPIERDLMFVINDKDAQREKMKLFMNGYGPVSINLLALAYYRYEWVIQELADFGEQVFYLPDVGAKTRANAVRGFSQLFDKGDVIEAAYQADANLPSDDVSVLS